MSDDGLDDSFGYIKFAYYNFHNVNTLSTVIYTTNIPLFFISFVVFKSTNIFYKTQIKKTKYACIIYSPIWSHTMHTLVLLAVFLTFHFL